MSEKTIRFLLEEILTILKRHRVKQWINIIEEKQRKLLISYTSGREGAKHAVLEEIIGLYGGMGSFNDFTINPESGHDITFQEIGGVNKRLNLLRSQLYQLIQEEREFLNNKPM